MTNLWLVLNFVFGSFARFSSFPFVFLCFCTSVCLFICLFVCFFYQIPFAPSSPPLPTLLPPLPPLLPPLPTLLPLSHLFALFFCFLISSVSLIVREVIFFLLSFWYWKVKQKQWNKLDTSIARFKKFLGRCIISFLPLFKQNVIVLNTHAHKENDLEIYLLVDNSPRKNSTRVNIEWGNFHDTNKDYLQAWNTNYPTMIAHEMVIYKTSTL